MSEIDYFNEENIVKGGFVDFKEIGASVAGVYLGCEEKPNQLKPGEIQLVFTIKRDDGSIALVGDKAYIGPQMKFVKVGQRIALKYVADKPSKKPGMNPTKVINLYAPKNADGSVMMDSDYASPSVPVGPGMADPAGSFHEQAPNIGNEDDGEIKVDQIPFNSPTPEEMKLAEIISLAKQKLGVTLDAEVSMAAMKESGLAFLPENYDAILAKLRAKV